MNICFLPIEHWNSHSHSKVFEFLSPILRYRSFAVPQLLCSLLRFFCLPAISLSLFLRFRSPAADVQFAPLFCEPAISSSLFSQKRLRKMHICCCICVFVHLGYSLLDYPPSSATNIDARLCIILAVSSALFRPALKSFTPSMIMFVRVMSMP